MRWIDGHMALMVLLAWTLLGSCRADSPDSGQMDQGMLYIPWNSGYQVQAKGGTMAVPVNCEGEWSAVSDQEWVTVLNPSGVGNDTVRIYIDRNCWGQCREASVRIYLGSNVSKGYDVTFSQDKSSALFVSDGIANGAGFSYDISKPYCQGVAYAVFDLDYLDSLQSRVNQYFVMDDWTPYSEDQFIQGESMESVNNQISANAAIELNAQLANASVKGTVTVSTSEEETKMYAVMRTKRIVYSRDVQYANIIQYYRETADSCVFAPGFFRDWKKIDSYGMRGLIPPLDVVRDFLGKWGVGLVARSYMGGCVEYRISVDRSVLTQLLDIKAAAQAAVAGGVLNADGSAEWKEENEKIANHHSLDVEVYGGDVQSVAPIVFGNSITMMDLGKWMDSVSFSEDGSGMSSAVLVDMKVVTMANLFSGEVRKAVRQVIEQITEQ